MYVDAAEMSGAIGERPSTFQRFKSFVGRISKRTICLLLLAFFFLGISLVFEKLAVIQRIDQPITLDTELWSLATLSELLREIAFALGIAFALIATVELETHHEFSEAIKQGIREIQKNVFKATFQRDIPADIIDEVNNLIFGADFVRHEHSSFYNLKVINVHDLDSSAPPHRVIQLDMHSSYIVENVGILEKPFEIKLSLEKQPFDILNKFIEVTLTSLELDNKPVILPPPYINDDDRRRSALWISPNVPPRSRLRVETQSRTIKLMTDYEIWRSVYPTSRLTLNVVFPDGAISFGGDPLHRLTLRTRALGPWTREYQTKSAVLPHQGIVVWWCCEAGPLGRTPHMGGDAERP